MQNPKTDLEIILETMAMQMEVIEAGIRKVKEENDWIELHSYQDNKGNIVV